MQTPITLLEKQHENIKIRQLIWANWRNYNESLITSRSWVFITQSRNNHLEVFCKKRFLKNIANLEKNICSRTFFISGISFKPAESLFAIFNILHFMFYKFSIFAIICQIWLRTIKLMANCTKHYIQKWGKLPYFLISYL